jgi:uncharacterized protein (DUF608 family)
MGHERNQTFFPTDLPGPEWVEFEAEGFSRPVTGVIYRDGEAVHGMPLGAIGTGYVNLDTDGTLGRCTLFNSFVPPREIGGIPFLGLAVGGRTWVLTLKRIEGVENASQIHYWGHYPVADLEYETDAPVSVGLRAWTPFLPGDSAGSNMPGAVFEVRLRNASDALQEGTIAFSFPGPSEAETRGQAHIERQAVEGQLTGVVMRSHCPVKGYVQHH